MISNEKPSLRPAAGGEGESVSGGAETPRVSKPFQDPSQAYRLRAAAKRKGTPALRRLWAKHQGPDGFKVDRGRQ